MQMKMDFTANPLSEARKDLFFSLGDGVVCPCCDRFAKKYKRTINSGESRILIWLFNNTSPEKWIHVNSNAPKFILRSNEISRLKVWGLAQEKTNDMPSQRNSGFYKITNKGIAFVLMKIKIPKYYWTYNNEVLGFSEEHIAIDDSLKIKFNYQELMSGNYE